MGQKQTSAGASVLFSVLLNACATVQHVEFEPPPALTDPYEKRASYYRDNYADELEYGRKGYLKLHDGRRVYFPEDLKSAVPSDTPVVQALDAYVELRDRAILLDSVVKWPGLAVAVAAVPVWIAPVLVPDLPASYANSGVESIEAFALNPWFMAGSSLFVIGIVAWTSGQLLAPHREAAFQRDRAILSYNIALSHQVGIKTGHGGELVDTQASEAEERAVDRVE